MNAPQHGRPPLFLVIGALYLAQGIPLGLIIEALPTLLRAAGVPMETVAFLPMATLPWMIKVAWAPFVDNHWLDRAGRRRSWIIPAQIVLAASLLGISALPINAGTAMTIVALLGVASLAAATQDIAIDGLAAERLGRLQMAEANSLQIGGMMAGMLVGGAGMLVLTDWLGGTPALRILAGLIIACALPVWLWRELPLETSAQPQPARVRNFFRREGGWALAAVMMIFAANRGIDMSLSKLFLVEQEWSLSRIGAIVASGSSLMVITGAAVAGPLVRRLGPVSVVVYGLLVALLGTCLWGGLALTGGTAPLWAVAMATALGSVGFGLSAVAAFTMAFRFAHDSHQAGTDMTVAQCLHTLGEMIMVPPATYLTAKAGFAGGFGVSIACTLLAMMIVVQTRRSCDPLPLERPDLRQTECA